MREREREKERERERERERDDVHSLGVINTGEGVRLYHSLMEKLDIRG